MLPPMQPGLELTDRIRADLLKTNAQEERAYLGMSGIYRCAYEWWNKLVNHPAMPPAEQMRMAQYHETGYMHEAKVKWRLERIGLYVPNSEYTVVAPFKSAGGIPFMGHTDGAVNGEMLLEIKSVSCRRYRTVDSNRAPFPEHLAQVNCYMRYGPWTSALIVYVDRCTYQWLALVTERDDALGEELEQKAKMILKAVDDQVPPVCTCGYC